MYIYLISIVFIAELIITFTIIISLYKFDKNINKFNSFLNEVKPDIKDIMQTLKNLSEQLITLAPFVVSKIKSIVTDMIIGQLKNTLGAITFWLVKKEVEKHI